MIKTLVNCHALLGENARPSDGPVDIVIDGKKIRDVRPAGSRPPEGLALMRRIKAEFDPKGLLNPGRFHVDATP